MAVNLILILAIFSSLLVLATQDQPLQALRHQANLKVAQLESTLQDVVQTIKARELYLEESEKQIDEMQKEIVNLQSTLSNLKADEKVKALEEEVRILWAASKKNNFDLYVLETKSWEATARLETLSVQVEKMEDIVAEQWIQIQQFEQALQLRQIGALKGRKQANASRCTLLKLIDDIFKEYLPTSLQLLGLHLIGEQSSLRSQISQTFHLLNRSYSIMKRFHHELQASVKQEMERHEFTACLANQEMVFFVASALIIFPFWGAWMLLSSWLR